jgi:guanine deaminase
MQHPNTAIMQKAIVLAKKSSQAGDYAVAAIIVLDDQVLTEASTTITREQDPTAHAELNARHCLWRE